MSATLAFDPRLRHRGRARCGRSSGEGKEHWRIYSSAFTPTLRPVVASFPYFTSRLDARTPEDEHP